MRSGSPCASAQHLGRFPSLLGEKPEMMEMYPGTSGRTHGDRKGKKTRDEGEDDGERYRTFHKLIYFRPAISVAKIRLVRRLTKPFVTRYRMEQLRAVIGRRRGLNPRRPAWE